VAVGGSSSDYSSERTSLGSSRQRGKCRELVCFSIVPVRSSTQSVHEHYVRNSQRGQETINVSVSRVKDRKLEMIRVVSSEAKLETHDDLIVSSIQSAAFDSLIVQITNRSKHDKILDFKSSCMCKIGRVLDFDDM